MSSVWNRFSNYFNDLSLKMHPFTQKFAIKPMCCHISASSYPLSEDRFSSPRVLIFVYIALGFFFGSTPSSFWLFLYRFLFVNATKIRFYKNPSRLLHSSLWYLSALHTTVLFPAFLAALFNTVGNVSIKMV